MMESLPDLKALQFSLIDGVEVELRHVLPEGWEFECRSSDYLVRGEMVGDWRHQVWRVAEFLRCDDLVVLRAVDWPGVSRCYEFVSAMKSGTAFRLYFLICEPSE